MEITYSLHGRTRAAQRNLGSMDIEYVLTYGRCFHQAGALIWYLRRQDIPSWDQANSALMRLAGTAVVASKDGRMVITVWRNLRTGLKKIRRKPKFSRESAASFLSRTGNYCEEFGECGFSKGGIE